MEFIRYWQPGMKLSETERLIIEREYERQGENREKTAKSLGVSPRTISNKLASYKVADKIKADRLSPTLKREAAIKESHAKQKAATG